MVIWTEGPYSLFSFHLLIRMKSKHAPFVPNSEMLLSVNLHKNYIGLKCFQICFDINFHLLNHI